MRQQPVTLQRPPLSVHSLDGRPAAAVGPGVGQAFVQSCFPEATERIRVATAYFSLSGYRLGRQYIGPDVQLHILVGREEGEHLQQAVIAEIDRELRQCEVDLHDTIADLVQRMKDGRFIIRDARRIPNPFHCKFYICDEQSVWHGSANYTKNGLRGNAEQASVSRDPDQVALFARWFDLVLPQAEDLIPPLVARLEAWLKMAAPFDVYLLTLLSLIDLPDRKHRMGAHVPAYYQKYIVARGLRQLESFNGSVLIVATGLGKTVIASEIASRMRERGQIDRVLLIAPNAVHVHWDQQLDGRGIPSKHFSTESLFRKPSRKGHHITFRLDKQLALADANTLILVDEVHYYRNQLLVKAAKEGHSRVYERLGRATSAGAKIVLLTATPYATSVQNLHSLLYALPPTRPGTLQPHEPWQTTDPADFVTLPVVTTLGLPEVLREARRRGDVDESDRPFVRFPDADRYLPRTLRLRVVRYTLPFRAYLEPLFDKHCFDAKKIRHFSYDDDRGEFEGISDSVFNASVDSWLSSPPAVLESLKLNVETPGKPDLAADADSPQLTLDGFAGSAEDHSTPVGRTSRRFRTTMHVARAHRIRLLTPMIKVLKSRTPESDPKLVQLQAVVAHEFGSPTGKMLVFVRRYQTALYLQAELAKAFPNLHVAATVSLVDDVPRLMTPTARAELRQRFAPEAHEVASADPLDILISTDADSVGVNLQDAPVVVNYDPPPSADALFQRAGRVLRMTPDRDRIVTLYTFVPDVLDEKDSSSIVIRKMQTAFTRLAKRHEKASDILRSPVYAPLDLDVTLDRDIDVAKEAEADTGRDTQASSYLHHLATLEQYRARVESLLPPLLSCRTYDGTKRRVFALVRLNGHVEVVFYNDTDKVLEARSELETLNLLACSVEHPVAVMSASLVEHAVNSALARWCERDGCDLESVEKLCALYLIPEGQEGTAAEALFAIS